MTKLLKSILVLGVFIFVFCSLGFPQAGENITITTYYPSPFGVYRVMRLQPGPRPLGVCQDGDMYYDNGVAVPADVGPWVCFGGAWQALEVGRFWEIAGNPNDIHNTNLGNVGIGTNNPGTYKLNVSGGKFIATSNVYDSGWFAIAAGNDYTLAHNLGTTAVIVQVLLADNAAGNDPWPAESGADFSALFYYVAADRIRPNDIRIITSSGGWKTPCWCGKNSICPNAVCLGGLALNGFCRVLMWALD